MAAGVGYYEAAVATTALVLITLWPLRIMAYRLSTRVRPEEGRIAVNLPAGASAVSVLAAVEEAGVAVSSLEFEDEGETRRVDLRVRLPSGRSAAALMDELTKTESVRGARWNP
jgi:uncharacterized membrane protein YhiD involved in acid resistance